MAVEHAGNDKVKAAFVEHAEHSDITDDNKDALLLLCACRGLASRVRAVLQAGANAANTTQEGKTALIVACEEMREAAAAELMEATKRAGALDLQDTDRKTALHVASERGLAGTVAKLLALGADAALGATLHDWRGEGVMAFELAGNDEVKAAFVEHAEYCDITDDNKDDLLLLCAQFGLASRVRAVLQAGANAHHTNHHWPHGPMAPLMIRVVGNGPPVNDEVKAAFLEHAEHCDITDDNKNGLLLLCAFFGLASRVRAVLQAGANAAHTHLNGSTALILACEFSRAAAAAELMEATKRAGALHLQRGGCGRNAMDWAVTKHMAGTKAKLQALGAKCS